MGRGCREASGRKGERGRTDGEGRLGSRPTGRRDVGQRKYGSVGRGCAGVHDRL